MGKAERMDSFVAALEERFLSNVCHSLNLAELDISGLLSIPLTSRATFPDKPCVYMAVDCDGFIHYIGKSIRPRQRWACHVKYGPLSEKNEVKIAYLFLDEKSLDNAEQALIELYRPPMNVHYLGKNRDPNYKQVGVYVRKDIYRQVKSRAVTEGIEISDLVEKLFCEWLGLGA